MGTAKQSTQAHLPISEIRDDCVLLKDGSLRAVILVSSINFALKSDDEQKAIISAYVSLLNSFDFPWQIVVQSRPLNIAAYVEELKVQEEKQSNDLLRLQIAEYRQFVSELVTLGEIMTKRFYVVVPYAPGRERYKTFWEKLADLFSIGKVIALGRKDFDRYQEELAKRVDYMMSGLSSMSLQSIRLDTQSLIELSYNTYNPITAFQEKLVEMNKLRVEEEKGAITE
ncbi:MAG: hypothetical protein V1707_01020 [bacterium]